MKKAAIMQPYFLPYIGYWQLISAVDVFVVYDNIQYTKKGWFNRNRFLQNGKSEIFSIPLKKDSSFKNVNERMIFEDFDKKHLLAKFRNAYAKAPCFIENFEIIEKIVNYEDENLFNYIYNSILLIKDYLGINTPIVKYSSLDINDNLLGENKVIEICKKLEAKWYINAIGGQDLYDKKNFLKEGIQLNFIKTKAINYKQFNSEFVENLSILDVIMFNDKHAIKKILGEYNLI